MSFKAALWGFLPALLAVVAALASLIMACKARRLSHYYTSTLVLAWIACSLVLLYRMIVLDEGLTLLPHLAIGVAVIVVATQAFLLKRMKASAMIVSWLLVFICGSIVSFTFPKRAPSSYHSSAACRRNLKCIENAKEVWAFESTNDVPTWADIPINRDPTWTDISPYLMLGSENSRSQTNGRPICPTGGTYTIGRLDEPPKCSMGRERYHSL